MKTVLLTSTLLVSAIAFGQDAGDVTSKLDTLFISAKESLIFLAEMLGALTVLATIIARKTKSTKDDETISDFTKWYLKILGYLPTLGVNPKTKRMEEELAELKISKP